MLEETVGAPQVGAWVYHEGQWWTIEAVALKGETYQPRRDSERTEVAQEDLVFFESEETYTKASRGGRPERTRPRFRVRANLADMRWSPEFEAFYLWGRALAKGKGRVGGQQGQPDQRAIVVFLRDRGILPARATRETGQRPAGGEHENLSLALFCDTPINWEQEMANVRRGEGLTEAAHAAVEAYKVRYARPLARGYASPDAADSGEG